jgi:hypothetical protein
MKVRFYLSIGIAGGEIEEIVHLDDTLTHDEIEKEYQEWKNDLIDGNWWRL